MNNLQMYLRVAGACLALTMSGVAAAACPAYLNQDLQKLHSKETVNICKAFAGKPVLIVNTASHCGYTPQFKGLQALFEKYKGRGLEVIGFPSNDFNQEAKEETQTADVCYVNYGVKFTMVSPSSVKGESANPIFKELARQTKAPTWNFNKYLVNADGAAKYFPSNVTPDSADLTQAIEGVLTAAK